MAWIRLKTALEVGKLKVQAPKEKFLDKVKAIAANVGDAFLLSETDLQVLALALELKTYYCVLIVTDDYSIQNVSKKIGIKFASLSTFGIRRLIKWIRYCPACYRKYPANANFRKCTVCGIELKRKPQRAKKDISRS